MTFSNPIRICLVAAALVCNTNAFTVVPPVAIDVPANQEFVAVTAASAVQTTSSSNIPSQMQLLDNLGSFTVAASAPATKAPESVAPAKAAPKSTGIIISDIFFDGKVPKTEADEYVVVQNSSKDVVDISGYILYPATSGTQGSTFIFPKGSTIKPNSSVRVYTNEIHKETGGYSWGSGKALWSNKGGLAVLKDSSGKKLGEYKYNPAS